MAKAKKEDSVEAKKVGRGPSYSDTIEIVLEKGDVLKLGEDELYPLSRVLEKARQGENLGVYQRLTVNVVRGHYAIKTALGLRMIDVKNPMVTNQSSVVIIFKKVKA
jgi:hypothetical protein